MNFSVNLAPEVIEHLDELAYERGISKSSVIRFALHEFLIKNRKEKNNNKETTTT
jgi:metal-responsive CopG/Arc/MetJ family transcriptional regulator